MKYDIDSIVKRKKYAKIIKVTILIFFIIILYNVILLWITSIQNNKGILGYQAYIITSDSMFPELKIGDVIIIKKQDNIEKDDIITFEQEGITNTHRVIDIVEKDEIKEYITKGDNNNAQDKKVTRIENIKGKVIIKIPYLGKLAKQMQDKIILLIMMLIFLLICLYTITKNEKKEKRRMKRKIEEEKNK